jgi:hypothetical protein
MKRIVWDEAMVKESLDKLNNGYILKRIENPFFENIIGPDFGLRREGITYKMSDYEQQEYINSALDIIHFSSKYCWIKGDDGSPILFPPRDYQIEQLNDFQKYRFNILMASRQVSKTVMSAITILHFVLFNNTKNVLVAANKLETAVEILDKMKEIYQRLPFFLQQGILNWNQKLMLLENKSKIKGFATTKTSSIGNTGDMLFIDEFAHLQDNIKEKFFKSIIPTIANIDNSRIIITSTPKGFDLFRKLLVDAERPAGDPLKNNFHAKRIYWYQVPKRFCTYIRFNKNLQIDRSNQLTSLIEDDRKEFNPENVLEYLRERYPNNEMRLAFNIDLGKEVITIYNNEYCSESDILNEEFEGIRLVEVTEITTWKKEAIKDIGSEEAFNQEYDLRFIDNARCLLDESTIEHLNKNKSEYEHTPIDLFEKKLKFSYKDLKFNTDTNIYNIELRKKYKIVISIDISEGLGEDYSVINIFKVDIKDMDMINLQSAKYESIVDFFKIVQIGLFRSNIISVKQLSELAYMIIFEHFESDNVLVIVEINNYGNELMAHLPNVFDGNNNYGYFPFLKYKHRVDATDEKVGLKITGNKNLLVKDYQDRMLTHNIVINNEDTIGELTIFIKHITSSGNIIYSADGSGNDDQSMTVVHSATVFKHPRFRQMVEEMLDKDLDPQISSYVKSILNVIDEYTGQGNDYKQLLEIRKRQIMMKQLYK